MISKIGQLFDEYSSKLSSIYELNEANAITRIVFREKLGLSRAELALNRQNLIDEAERLELNSILDRLMVGEPLQYIFGEVEFQNCKLRVNNNVLIPRPETEELVQWILNETKISHPNILDIGTGSGCISISLAKNIPKSIVTAVDVSPEALALAQINAETNEVNIAFKNLDILNDIHWGTLSKQDIIVSNPPYVLESEKGSMQINVLNFEPLLALFVTDNDPLIFYKKITELATQKLNPSGKLYFEINEAYGEKVKELMESYSFHSVEIRQDIHGKNRMCRGLI